MWRLYSLYKNRRRRQRSFHRQLVESLEARTLLTFFGPDAPSYDTYLVVFDDAVESAASGSSAGDSSLWSHDDFTESLRQELGESVSVRFSYTNAIDAMAIWLTESQAQIVEDLPAVADVLLDSTFALQRNSAELTGAPEVWDGTALSNQTGTLGAGVLIGVIDSGIDFDNASFAQVGPVDGYQHTNPFGSGTFVGVCDPTSASFDESLACNDKVVGAYDFTPDTQINDSNFSDHGTSVAGIAAGNFVSTVVPGTNQATEVSGVAPHANLISYDVCDSNDNCSSSAILAAVDQAIEDGVDVINMSIGGPTENPWSAVMATAMWNAHNAGIFVAVSAGNEGPELASLTAPADSPWVTAVASTDTSFVTTINVDVVDADVPSLLTAIAALRGEDLDVTADLGPAPIIHVADVAPGDHLGSSTYAANSLAGRIALIDRGESLFEIKVRNAWEAGAIGVVMINNVEGPLVTMAGVSQFPIPSVMISRDNGARLRQWIQENPNTQLRINAQQDQQLTSVATFSSRGENEQADTLAPHIAAPGADTSVIAPVATTGIDEWEFFSGTSAASPHIAGAAALIAAVHPTWSPSEIQSALQTTARNQDIVTGTALIPANAFDVGSGQVDVAAAVNAGLVLNETSQQFRLADPASAGDPSSLNLASFVDSDVTTTTSWTRTLKNTQSTSVAWTPVFESDSGLSLQLDTTAITVGPSAEVSFTLTAQIDAGAAAEWMFGELTLQASIDLPDAHFPVAVKPTPFAGVRISQSGSGTDVSESGTADTYAVQLLTDPNGLVQVEVNAPPQLEISTDGEVFSSSVVLAINDAFPRTITVRATDDAVAESTRLKQITHAVIETSNADYPVGFVIKPADVRVFDNDIGQLQLTTLTDRLTEGGASAVATISRSDNSQLDQPLLVSLSASQEIVFLNAIDQAVSVIAIPAGQTTVTVQIMAVDNVVIDGSRSLPIRASAASFEPGVLTIEIVDDDFASLKTVESSGSTVVTRSGSADSFTAQLRTQPTGDVVFDVISQNPNGVVPDTHRLTFTASNWDSPQTVTVTGTDDNSMGVMEVVITIVVIPELSASEYESVAATNVVVSLVDAGATDPLILGPQGRTLRDPVTYRWIPVEGAESYDVYVERTEDSGNPILETTVTDSSFVAAQQGIGSYRFWVRANFATAPSSAWIGETYQISTSANILPVPYFADDTRPELFWDSVPGATAYQISITNRTTGQSGLVNRSDLTTTSFVPDNDFTFGEHRIWVRALGTNGFAADWSAPVDYFVGPSLLTPTTSTFERTPTFLWSSVDGADSHEIYIRRPDGSSLVESGLADSYQPTQELSIGRHVWWVRASTAAGQKGPWSQPSETFIGGRTTLTEIGTTAEAAPAFQWADVEGAVEYELFLNRTDVSQHVYSMRLDTTSWRSTILPDGEYTAWVRPIDDLGEAGLWSPALAFEVQAAQTSTVVEPSRRQFVSFFDTPQLSWSASTAAVSYDVFIHDGLSGSQHSGIRQTSWTAPALSAATASWWVRAVDSAGNVGAWSFGATIDTTGRPATNPPVIDGAAAAVFTWTAVEGADRYILQIDNLSTGQTQVIREEQLTAPTFTTPTGLPSGNYRFWVRAIRNASPSDGFWSIAQDFSAP